MVSTGWTPFEASQDHVTGALPYPPLLKRLHEKPGWLQAFLLPGGCEILAVIRGRVNYFFFPKKKKKSLTSSHLLGKTKSLPIWL